jgi:hypothetical protein
MNDINHAWNTARPIRTKKQHCGCHITAKTFSLCVWGRDLKKSADGWHKLYESDKNPTYTDGYRGNFEIHKNAYIKHITRGKDWAL